MPVDLWREINALSYWRTRGAKVAVDRLGPRAFYPSAKSQVEVDLARKAREAIMNQSEKRQVTSQRVYQDQRFGEYNVAVPVREPARASVVERTEYVDLGDTIVPPEHDLQAAVGPLSPGTAFQLPVVPPTMAALASAGVAGGLATRSTLQTEMNQEGILHEQNESTQLVSRADPSYTQE